MDKKSKKLPKTFAGNTACATGNADRQKRCSKRMVAMHDPGKEFVEACRKYDDYR